MNHFGYRNGRLHAEDVALATIAESVGTPFYCYSTATLQRHYGVFADAFAGENALVCYSLKGNSNQAVIATLAALGAGADVVSEGELRRALAAGIPAERIVFPGSARSRAKWPLPLMRAFTSSTWNQSLSWRSCRPLPPPGACARLSPSG